MTLPAEDIKDDNGGWPDDDVLSTTVQLRGVGRSGPWTVQQKFVYLTNRFRCYLSRHLAYGQSSFPRPDMPAKPCDARDMSASV